MDGVPGDLPSLLYAHKVQRKAASVGFDWDDVDGALPEGRRGARRAARHGAVATAGSSASIEAELGDLLFAVVNVARHLDVDPEAALRGASAKFRTRFQLGRSAGRRPGVETCSTMDLAALDALWDEAKALPLGTCSLATQQHQQHSTRTTGRSRPGEAVRA